MGPALVIPSLKAVVPVVGQQSADGDVHEVALFLLRKVLPPAPELLHADEKEQGVEVRQPRAAEAVFDQVTDALVRKIFLPFGHAGYVFGVLGRLATLRAYRHRSGSNEARGPSGCIHH